MNRPAKTLVASTMGLTFALSGCGKPAARHIVLEGGSLYEDSSAAIVRADYTNDLAISQDIGIVSGCRLYRITDPKRSFVFYLAVGTSGNTCSLNNR